jgi:hypothetical protein
VFLPFMLFGIYRALQARGEEFKSHAFALTYFLTFLLVLSSQGVTKTWYFLSAFPACAGLAAVGFNEALARVSFERIVRVAGGFAVAVFLVLNVTPVRISSDRAVDIRRLAPFVREAAAQGFMVTAFKIDFYSLNASLLFYSDQAARNVDEAELRSLLALPDQKVALLVNPEDWEGIVRPLWPDAKVVRRTDKWIMVTNQTLNQENVFQ